MMLDSPAQIGYCTNVHPGRDLRQVQQQLAKHSIVVRQMLDADEPLGIGLWLSATAVTELNDERRLDEFGDWLEENQLVPFTINGFPYGDFHQETVRHAVYRPSWAEPQRLRYTEQLADIQHRLLPKGTSGSISTLPLAWPSKLTDPEATTRQSAAQLRQLALYLRRLFDDTGREITVCIEPEPGCLLDTADDLVCFFEQFLLTGNGQEDENIFRFIRVCHDICHSAVMFESQHDAIQKYRGNNIRIGKVQVSAAIEMTFAGDSSDEPQRHQLSLLANERRYLHQTVVRHHDSVVFHEDLEDAIKAANGEPAGQWRIHFHVPVYCSQIGALKTTNEQIEQLLDACLEDPSTMPHHFEVETYAWDVFPGSWPLPPLTRGITNELNWFRALYHARTASQTEFPPSPPTGN